MARLTAENYALERFSNMRHSKRTAFFLFTIISAAAAAVMILTSDFLSRNVVGEPSTKYMLSCALPHLLFSVPLCQWNAVTVRACRIIPTAVSEVIETLFKLILGLGFAYGLMYHISDMYDKTGMIFGTAYENSRQAASAALPFIAAAAILGSSIASAIACLYILISGKIKGDSVTKQIEVFICVLSVRSVCKMTDLKPKVSEIFVKPTYAAIMCSVTAILSHETLTKIAHLQINHRFVTLFSIGIGSTMYFFCLYLLCETPKNIVNCIFSKKNPQNP